MLTSTIVQLKNRRVWSFRRRHAPRIEWPTLRFRRGLIPQHGPQDMVLAHYYEVFRYRIDCQYIREPRRGAKLDIGAVSLEWATPMPRARINAYEQHPDTFAMLAENVAAKHLLKTGDMPSKGRWPRDRNAHFPHNRPRRLDYGLQSPREHLER
jgi:hypothetical protein